MKKRLLFFCYTPFQCITALMIRENMFSDEEADIILDDSISQRDSIKKGLESMGVFSEIYYANLRSYFPKGQKGFAKEKNRLVSSFFPEYLASEIKFENTRYDIFFTTEINYYTESLYYILRKNNQNITVSLMDEGYSSYTYYFREAYKPTYLKNRIKRLLFRIPGKLTGRKYIADNAKSLYLFDPDLQCWNECEYEVVKITLGDEEDTRNIINNMFEFNKNDIELILDNYSKPVCFFEESFYFSNNNSNDTNMILNLYDFFGKENFMVKLHPRNKWDRFSSCGITVGKSTGLPWELTAINLPDSDSRVFISYSSGAVLNYKFLTGKGFNTILLYKCYSEAFSHVEESLKRWFEKYELKYGTTLYIPKDLNELNDVIEKIKDEIDLYGSN